MNLRKIGIIDKRDKLNKKLPVLATVIMTTAGTLIGCGVKEANDSKSAEKETFYTEEVKEAMTTDLSGKIKEYMVQRNITTKFTSEDIKNIKRIVVEEVETNYVSELTPELKKELESQVNNIFKETTEGYYESSDSQVDTGLKNLVNNLTANLAQADENFKGLLNGSADEIATLTQSLTDVESRLKGVEDEIKPYSKPETQIGNLDQTVKDFETSFNAYKTETDEKIATLQSNVYNAHTDELAAFTSSYETYKDGVDKIITTLKSEVATLKNKDVLDETETAALKESYSSLRSTLNNTVEALNTQKTSEELLDSALKELQKSVDGNIVSLTEIQSKLNETSGNAESNLSSLSVSLADLKNYVEETVETNVASNKSGTETNAAKILENVNAINSINSSLTDMQTTLNVLQSTDETNVQLLETKVLELNNAITQAKTETETALTETISSNFNSLSESLNVINETLSTDISTAADKADTALSNIEVANVANDSRFGGIESNITTLQTFKTTTANSLVSINEDVSELATKITSVEGTIADYGNVKSTMNKLVKDLDDEKENIILRFSDTSDELSKKANANDVEKADDDLNSKILNVNNSLNDKADKDALGGCQIYKGDDGHFYITDGVDTKKLDYAN